MGVNFFSLYFEENNVLPSIKEGVRVELKNNILYLNGVCSQEIFNRPQERKIEDNDIDKLFFLYPDDALWVAKEEDGRFYLYKGFIEETNLYLTSNMSKNIVYLSVELSSMDSVSIDEGRVISRIFAEDKQICILAVEEGANIIIEGAKSTIIVEWNGKEFLYK